LKKGLAGEHEVEVMVRPDAEDFENLVQHATVLGSGTDDSAELRWPGSQMQNQRREFDGFRARAENE
jgi:hypothetical protein